MLPKQYPAILAWFQEVALDPEYENDNIIVFDPEDEVDEDQLKYTDDNGWDAVDVGADEREGWGAKEGEGGVDGDTGDPKAAGDSKSKLVDKDSTQADADVLTNIPHAMLQAAQGALSTALKMGRGTVEVANTIKEQSGGKSIAED